MVTKHNLEKSPSVGNKQYASKNTWVQNQRNHRENRKFSELKGNRTTPVKRGCR
jgi:hypothetical protein